MIPQPEHKVESAGLKIGFMKPKTCKKLLLLFLAGMLSLHVVVAWRSWDLARKGYPDFTAFYSAGKIVREGLGRQLYDSQTQYHIQQEFAAGVSIRQGALPYNHPPFEAIIFAPLAWLPYFSAYLLWDLVNVMMLLAVVLLLQPYIPMLQRSSAFLWVLVSLAFFPVFIALLQGQDIILFLLLITLAFVALKKGAAFSAGCWLGLGLFRFHMVLPLVFILLLQKRRKTLLGFVLVAFALGIVSVAIVGWDGVLHYPGYVWHLEAIKGRGAIVAADMPNLRGLVSTVLTPRSSKLVADVAIGLLTAALLLLASSNWRVASTGTLFDLGFSLTLIVTVLVSYHALDYDLSLLFPAVLLLINHLQNAEPPHGWLRLALFGPIFILFLSPLYIMVLFLRYGHLTWLASVLLLWCWGLASEISRYRLPPEQKTT